MVSTLLNSIWAHRIALLIAAGLLYLITNNMGGNLMKKFRAGNVGA